MKTTTLNIILLYGGLIDSIHTIICEDSMEEANYENCLKKVQDIFFSFIRRINPMISKLELNDAWKNYQYDNKGEQEVIIKEGVLFK